MKIEEISISKWSFSPDAYQKQTQKTIGGFIFHIYRPEGRSSFDVQKEDSYYRITSKKPDTAPEKVHAKLLKWLEERNASSTGV